jgi:hypothetical protein
MRDDKVDIQMQCERLSGMSGWLDLQVGRWTIDGICEADLSLYFRSSQV